MKNPAPHQAVRNAAIRMEVAGSRAVLDREAHQRKQRFLLLDAVQKRHDYELLIEMNGERCASRQIYDLRVYDWQRRAA